MIILSCSLKCCLHLVIGLLLASLAHAADIRETARAVAERSKDALVTVRVVMGIEFSIRGQSRDQERKIETNGTIIDSSGLTVASASALDPTIMMRAATRADIKSEFKETTLILDDGTEVDAEVILKASDLDMIFIKPRQAEGSFQAVVLEASQRQPQMLDPVFAVGRLGKIGNRAIRLHLGRVEARVKGPRPFYVCDAALSGNLGCIVYDSQGAPLGILVTKQNPAGVAFGGSRLSGNQLILPILRTIEDLVEMADQAREAQAKLQTEPAGGKPPSDQ